MLEGNERIEAYAAHREGMGCHPCFVTVQAAEMTKMCLVQVSMEGRGSLKSSGKTMSDHRSLCTHQDQLKSLVLIIVNRWVINYKGIVYVPRLEMLENISSESNGVNDCTFASTVSLSSANSVTGLFGSLDESSPPSDHRADCSLELFDDALQRVGRTTKLPLSDQALGENIKTSWKAGSCRLPGWIKFFGISTDDVLVSASIAISTLIEDPSQL